MAEIKGKGVLRLILNWGDEVEDLDLFTFFNVNKYIECRIFFGNKNCVQTELLTDNSKNGAKGGETLSVDSLGSFKYTFAVNKFQDRSRGIVKGEYNENTKTYDNSNPVPWSSTKITDSRAKVAIYSPHYLNAIVSLDIPTNVNMFNTVGEYDKNKFYDWWVLFCLDGKEGMDSLKVINRFVSYQPSGKFCSEYDEKKNLSFAKLNTSNHKLKAK